MIFNYDEEGKLLSVFEKKNGIDHPQIRKQYDKAGHLVEELSEIGKTVLKILFYVSFNYTK